MTFLNFSQLPESVFPSIFLGTPKFFRKILSWKPSQIFLLLESVFHWPTFLMANKHKKVWKVISRKTNTAKGKTLFWKPNHIFYWLKLTGKYFPLTGKCFPLTRKYFPLTNFSNDKQTQKNWENNFPKTTFRKTNMACSDRIQIVKWSHDLSLTKIIKI